MHASLALVLSLAACAAGSPARLGLEKAAGLDRASKHFDFVLGDDHLTSQKNRAKLVTKWRPDESVASEHVILESNVVRIVRPAKREAEDLRPSGGELVRRRRGYNLENVRVPARYPYLPVANFNRFRRWG